VASLSQIRTALTETISESVESDIFVYANVSDVVQCPALIIEPGHADYTVTFSLDVTYEFIMYILVSRRDTVTAQEELDEFVSHAGPNSIRQAVFDNPTLGLDNIDAFVHRLEGYGGSFLASQVPHVGAKLMCRVQADESAEPEVT
jgi:hypothetical protein